MAGSYNPETNAIELPAGDTMTLTVNVSGGYDAVVFAIFDPTRSKGADLLRIPAEIIDGRAIIRLANSHTRDLKAGAYKWQLRAVSDPARDADGNIIADDPGDNVVSYFGSADKPLPEFTIRRDGAYV